MSFRYMGTKRALAPTVREAIGGLAPDGPVADLFSGMGTVADTLASTYPVLTNDALAFTTAFARARFLPTARAPVADVKRAHDTLSASFCQRLDDERTATDSGRETLAAFMRTAEHVGKSASWAAQADRASKSRGRHRYQLATLYSASYFSTRQTLQLDALR